ncbi:hypothetical protein TD95_004104 [Thielaviopsis punctulata]|uniref:Eukaryotic translation initiation factor 3 subunit J n=1 Tax=Thielaviopsis punctulata TaxID=72032 RepID=A0A0F4ZAF6_9PEZI|nr:hypothetical protein TD95_004104 [Thielaviopsis punctulata]
MAPKWDDEEEVTSAPPSPPPAAPLRRAGKFDDEEENDSDVLDSWDADDSEVEREKAKKAAEAKAAEAAKPKKSKAERIAELKAQRAAELLDDGDEEETEAERRARLRRSEKESDLHHAEDLFGDIGINPNRKGATIGTAVMVSPNDPLNTVDMTKMPLFNPTTKTQFESLRNTLVPLLNQSAKKPQYSIFLQEFTKQVARELSSDQIKKIASGLTALSNEKMREEKASEKSGKKTKAAKTKTSLNASRPGIADTTTYDDDAFGE